MTRNIKLAAAALALGSIFSAAAMAAPHRTYHHVTLHACTKEGNTATLVANVGGTAVDKNGKRVDLDEVARTAFRMTAHELTDAELTHGEMGVNKGDATFLKDFAKVLDADHVTKLSQNFQFGISSSRVPVVTPGCTLK